MWKRDGRFPTCGSGAVCLGSVTKVDNYSFEATCHLSNGVRRFVHAQWRPSNTKSLRGGMITSRAVQ
jgi:hypothetical protein